MGDDLRLWRGVRWTWRCQKIWEYCNFRAGRWTGRAGSLDLSREMRKHSISQVISRESREGTLYL